LLDAKIGRQSMLSDIGQSNLKYDHADVFIPFFPVSVAS